MVESRSITVQYSPSVVAGSNPNADINLTAFFHTEYCLDIFFSPQLLLGLIRRIYLRHYPMAVHTSISLLVMTHLLVMPTMLQMQPCLWWFHHACDEHGPVVHAT